MYVRKRWYPRKIERSSEAEKVFAFVVCAWLERSVKGERVGYVFALMDKRCAGVFEAE